MVFMVVRDLHLDWVVLVAWLRGILKPLRCDQQPTVLAVAPGEQLAALRDGGGMELASGRLDDFDMLQRLDLPWLLLVFIRADAELSEVIEAPREQQPVRRDRQ